MAMFAETGGPDMAEELTSALSDEELPDEESTWLAGRYEVCLTFTADRFGDGHVCVGCGWLEHDHVELRWLADDLMERQAS